MDQEFTHNKYTEVYGSEVLRNTLSALKMLIFATWGK